MDQDRKLYVMLSGEHDYYGFDTLLTGPPGANLQALREEFDLLNGIPKMPPRFETLEEDTRVWELYWKAIEEKGLFGPKAYLDGFVAWLCHAHGFARVTYTEAWTGPWRA